LHTTRADGVPIRTASTWIVCKKGLFLRGNPFLYTTRADGVPIRTASTRIVCKKGLFLRGNPFLYTTRADGVPIRTASTRIACKKGLFLRGQIIPFLHTIRADDHYSERGCRMRYELRQYEQLIAAVVAATRGNVKAKKFVKYHQNAMGQGRSDWRLLARCLNHDLCDNSYQPPFGKLRGRGTEGG